MQKRNIGVDISIIGHTHTDLVRSEFAALLQDSAGRYPASHVRSLNAVRECHMQSDTCPKCAFSPRSLSVQSAITEPGPRLTAQPCPSPHN